MRSSVSFTLLLGLTDKTTVHLVSERSFDHAVGTAEHVLGRMLRIVQAVLAAPSQTADGKSSKVSGNKTYQKKTTTHKHFTVNTLKVTNNMFQFTHPRNEFWCPVGSVNRRRMRASAYSRRSAKRRTQTRSDAGSICNGFCTDRKVPGPKSEYHEHFD